MDSFGELVNLFSGASNSQAAANAGFAYASVNSINFQLYDAAPHAPTNRFTSTLSMTRALAGPFFSRLVRTAAAAPLGRAVLSTSMTTPGVAYNLQLQDNAVGANAQLFAYPAGFGDPSQPQPQTFTISIDTYDQSTGGTVSYTAALTWGSTL